MTVYFAKINQHFALFRIRFYGGAFMIKTIALNGDIKGSVKLNERNSRTEYELRLMKSVKLRAEAIKDSFTVLVSDAGLMFVDIDPNAQNGTADITGVKGFALANSDGMVISEGYVSLNRAQAEGYRERIRLALSQKRSQNLHSNKRADDILNVAECSEIEVKYISGRSPITGRILSQARELFYGSIVEDKRKSVESEQTQEESNNQYFAEIPNPFPKLYPNSTWKRRIGDENISGIAYLNGRKLFIEAYPYQNGVNTRMHRGQKYIAYGIDRKKYQLFVRKM